MSERRAVELGAGPPCLLQRSSSSSSDAADTQMNVRKSSSSTTAEPHHNNDILISAAEEAASTSPNLGHSTSSMTVGADGAPSSTDDPLSPPRSRLSMRSEVDDAASTSGSRTKSGSLRGTSSKIANLRAAFEKGSAAEMGAAKRRQPSTDGRKSSLPPEREKEYWREIARLRDERDKEADLRHAFEDKCAALGIVVGKLRDELESIEGAAATQIDHDTAGGEPESKMADELDQGKGTNEQEGVQSETDHETSDNTREDICDDTQDDAGIEEDDHAFLIKETQSTSNGEDQDEDLSTEIHKPKSLEVQDLERQIADLKRAISTSTRIETVATDSTFVQEMGMLHHELQNWIVNNFRRAKNDDPISTLRSEWEDLRPLYEHFEPTAKYAIYQATAVVSIQSIFAAPLLFGLARTDGEEWQTRICETADNMSSVLSPSAYNKWRAVTLDAIRHTDSLQAGAEAAGKEIAETICRVLSAVTEVEPSESRRTALNSIIKRTIALAHLFRVQRAQYEFELPTPGSAFDAASMENISGEDDGDDAGAQNTIRCAVFPSVTKLGDEFGDNVHYRNIIVKAKVLCYDADET